MADGAGSDGAGSGRGRRAVVVVVALVVAAVVVPGALLVLGHLSSRSVPAFASLQDAPDPALHGTAAYVDPSGCVQLIAASGAARRQVLCLDPLDPKDAEAKGKPQGPALRWRDDGRLEITMFRMTTPPGLGFLPGWQKVVDVRTGAVTITPEADLPSAPDLRGQVKVDPSGTTVVFTSDPSSGRVSVALVDAAGQRRTLLEARGPGEYTYGLSTAFWGPTFDYVVTDDQVGRILVITTGEPPSTRVLATQTNSGFDGAVGAYAFTAADLLAG